MAPPQLITIRHRRTHERRQLAGLVTVMEHIAVVRIGIEARDTRRATERCLKVAAERNVTILEHRARQRELLSFADADNLRSQGHGQHARIVGHGVSSPWTARARRARSSRDIERTDMGTLHRGNAFEDFRIAVSFGAPGEHVAVLCAHVRHGKEALLAARRHRGRFEHHG